MLGPGKKKPGFCASTYYAEVFLSDIICGICVWGHSLTVQHYRFRLPGEPTWYRPRARQTPLYELLTHVFVVWLKRVTLSFVVVLWLSVFRSNTGGYLLSLKKKTKSDPWETTNETKKQPKWPKRHEVIKTPKDHRRNTKGPQRQIQHDHKLHNPHFISPINEGGGLLPACFPIIHRCLCLTC